MRHLLILLLSTTLLAESAELPEKFYGKFDLDHSENFEEYLTAVGYGFITRKLIMFAKFGKVFTKASGGKFDYDNLTTKKDVHYKGVKLGKEFIGEGLDSTDHKIKFYMKGSHLFEKHVPVEKKAEAKPEEYEYYFEGPFLVLRMEAKGVVGKRFYKRV